jgi:hypothetical protein
MSTNEFAAWHQEEPGASTAENIRRRVISTMSCLALDDDAVIQEAVELQDWLLDLELRGVPTEAGETIRSLLHRAIDALILAPPERDAGRYTLAAVLGFLRS